MRMRIGLLVALTAMLSAVATVAEAAGMEMDPASVSEGLKAIFKYGNTTRQTAERLNANTVTIMTGTIAGTYVQFGADLASALDDGDNLRVLPIIGRGSVQGVADILFLKGVDLGIVRSDTLEYLEKKGYANNIKKQFSYLTKLHAMDYLVYAHLQLGQDAKASAIIDEMRTIAGFSETFIAGPFALAASPARYAVERSDWKAAAALEVRPNPLLHVQAVTYFAKALGAAHSGDSGGAQAAISKLAELRDQLREKKDAYWAEQVDIQWQVATAWSLNLAGKQDEALKTLSAAADSEDRTEKHPVTPGPLAPARELYGVMLLDRGMAKEALAAFEATLKKEPNRLGATVGAARAADKMGDAVKAKEYYTKVAELTGDADARRSDAKEARAFLAKIH